MRLRTVTFTLRCNKKAARVRSLAHKGGCLVLPSPACVFDYLRILYHGSLGDLALFSYELDD